VDKFPVLYELNIDEYARKVSWVVYFRNKCSIMAGQCLLVVSWIVIVAIFYGWCCFLFLVGCLPAGLPTSCLTLAPRLDQLKPAEVPRKPLSQLNGEWQ